MLSSVAADGPGVGACSWDDETELEAGRWGCSPVTGGSKVAVAGS